MEVLTPGKNNPHSLHPSKDPATLITPTDISAGDPILRVEEPDETRTISLHPGTIASNQSICYGYSSSRMTETVAPYNGTGSYLRQWQKSMDSINWENITGATRNNYSPSYNHTATVYYRVRYISGIETAYSNKVKIKVFLRIDPGTIGTNQSVVVGNTASLTEVTPASGGSSSGVITYQWYTSSNDIYFIPITGATSSNYTTFAITTLSYFSRTGVRGGCTSERSNSIRIDIIPLLTPGAIRSSQTIASGTIPIPLDQLTSCTGGLGVYTFQWEYSTDNIHWTVIGGATLSDYIPEILFTTTYYRRKATSGTQTAYTPVLTITVT